MDNEKYFKGEIAVWIESDCVDGFNVIFQNLYRNGIKEKIFCGFEVCGCFYPAISKRLMTDDFKIDYSGSGAATADIYL